MSRATADALRAAQGLAGKRQGLTDSYSNYNGLNRPEGAQGIASVSRYRDSDIGVISRTYASRRAGQQGSRCTLEGRLVALEPAALGGSHVGPGRLVSIP